MKKHFAVSDTVTVPFVMIILSLWIGSCVNEPAVDESEPLTPRNAVILTNSNFNELILKDETVALVEFYSSSCGTCSGMSWMIDSLATLKGDNVVIGMVDTDPEYALSNQYNITSVPSFLFFNNGSVLTRRTYDTVAPAAFDTLLALVDRLILGTLTTSSIQ